MCHVSILISSAPGGGQIPELKTVAFTDAGLDVGAAVTLTTLKDSLVAAVATQDEGKTAGFAALAEQVKWIGGTQVRNSATVGGSLVAGHIWGGTRLPSIPTPSRSFLTFLVPHCRPGGE